MAIGMDERCGILFSASWDTDITVWDCKKFTMLTKLTGHTNSVRGVAVDENFM